MADVTRFLTYFIQLTDPVAVKTYQAQFPYGYQFAPYNPHDNTTGQPGGAAVAFSAPWNGSTPVPAGVNGTWSPDAGNYPTNVATFSRHTGGFWGMGGTTTVYYWLGQFRAQDPATPTVGTVPPPAPVNLGKRLWIEGWEFGNQDGIANVGGSGMAVSRGAARHVGGFGLALRGPSSAAFAVSRNIFGAAANTRTWERFYVRLRVADGTNAIGFWEANGSVSGSSGARLAFTPDNRIALMNLDATGAESLLATSTAQITPWDGRSTLDGFHKIDIILRFNPNEAGPPIINTGRVTVYLDGVSIIDLRTIASSAGLGQAQNHISSLIGSHRSLVNTMECDVDDWSAMEWPGVAESAGGPTLTGRDWLSGTKIVAARAKAFGTNHSVNWAGAVQQLMQLPLSTAGNDSPLTSTTASAIAEADLDIDLCVAKDEGMLGVTAFVVHEMLFSNSVGTIGYRLNGAANVDVPDTEGAARTSCVVMKDLANGAAATFQAFTSLTVRHVKAADANAANISYMGAQVEMIGAWGTGEDFRTTESGGVAPVFPRFVDQHNAPYPRSTFGKGLAAPPPDSPVIFVAGTYVGNGTGFDLTFRAPVCAFFANATAAGGGGYRWISGGDGPHVAMNEGVHPALARADQDVTFVAGLADDTQQERYRIRIGGSNTTFNQLGITYQYLAIIDPGARFFLSGTVEHKAAQATTINNLINDSFTPEAMWFQAETLTNSTVDGGYWKGIGVTADNLLRGTTSAQLAAAVTLGTGFFTTQPAFHALSGLHMSYLAMRRHDGNNDPGEPGVLALVNWTGDGTASRTISIAPTSGKRPIYAVIFASDASGAYFRDIANTTTNSQRANSGANSATAITGGAIDALSVGVTLNANGTVYSGFVILGDATAGNGGFGVNNEYIPVEAAPPANGPFPTPTLAQVIPPVVVVPLTGEPDLDDTTNVLTAADNIGGLVGGSHCEFYTRKAVNIALSRIGISAQIANLATDTTKEAVVARRHVLEAMNATLRDFDWPFATGYATLVLVGGTSTVPVNADWQYSYRAPVGMMKARRLVGQASEQRTYDSVPILFRKGQDALGELIYTNQSNSSTALVLEFTQRVSCPAFFGDALFRNAFAWRIAAELAPALSRDEKRQQFCLQMYRVALGQSEVPAANEQQQAKDGDADWIADRMSGPLDPDWWRRNGA